MIPLQNIEMENIYLRSIGDGMRTLAITSSCRGEGVSSVAVALAQRHLLAGRSTLLVDLNDENPGHLAALPAPEASRSGASIEPQIVSDEDGSYALLGIPAPTNSRANLNWRNPGVLERYLVGWLDQVDAVIVDAGSFDRSPGTLIPTERIVGACDATLLTVMAGVTTEVSVRQTCERIRAAGGTLAGCILNDRVNPSLKQELLRETDRIPRFLGFVKQKINGWINTNRLLSLEL